MHVTTRRELKTAHQIQQQLVIVENVMAVIKKMTLLLTIIILVKYMISILIDI